MSNPQQPELARSRKTPHQDQDAVAAVVEGQRGTGADAPRGPVPPENQPGHHPEQEQDKPDVVPRARPRGRRAPEPAPETEPQPEPPRQPPTRRRFNFAFDPRMAAAALPFGITPLTARVEVADGELHARFGPWSVHTSVDNVASAEVTGPYSWPKVIGPPHLSLRDRGVTFATNTRRGVCIRFREPVSALVPGGLLKHPGLTVTVDRPEELVAALT